MANSGSPGVRSPLTRSKRRHAATALVLGGVGIGMLGLAYAAVPLYRIFCQATGYGGTTQRADAPSGVVLDRHIAVRFDANVAGGLPWSFKPVTRSLKLRLGETALVHYAARNPTSKRTMGTATFNVMPEAVGRYFNKIECFCFSEQVLEGGEKADLPVRFFIDPEMARDPDLAHVDEITLSYTFFPLVGGGDVVVAVSEKRNEGS